MENQGLLFLVQLSVQIRSKSARFGWLNGKLGFTAPSSIIGSDPVKIGLDRFGWQNGKSGFHLRIGLARLVQPIRLAKWKIRVYCPWFHYRFKSVKIVQTGSNRFVASPNMCAVHLSSTHLISYFSVCSLLFLSIIFRSFSILILFFIHLLSKPEPILS